MRKPGMFLRKLSIKSIKYKILLGFILIGGIAGNLVVGTVVWKLNQGISHQSGLLVEDTVKRANKTLNSHNELLSYLIENTKKDVRRYSADISSNKAISQALDSQQFVILKQNLEIRCAKECDVSEVDFALVYDIDGKLRASYPKDIDVHRAEEYLRSLELAKVMEDIESGAAKEDAAKRDFISKHDAEFLKAFQLSDNDKGGIVVATSGVVLDEFASPLGLVITGKFLNNHKKPLEQIYKLGSSSIIYLENIPIAQFGFETEEGTGLQLSRDVLSRIYASDEALNIILSLAGKRYLSSSSVIKSFKGEKIGVALTAIPEEEIIKIQKSMLSYSNQTKNTVLFWLLGIGVIATILFIFSALFIASGIVRPIKRVTDMVKDIAQGEGDLTKRLEINSKDEVGELAKWFNTFVDKLHHIISKVADSTLQVASASEELAASSSQISSGAERQKTQTEQIATSVEEMSATVLDIAKNANEAAEFATSATEKANKGGDIVENTVKGMSRIADAVKESAGAIETLKNSSEQIGEIISVIDDIADQTNLLALNAAIEAARAGEQGRGFAVVADEVRKLAERTTKATKEIVEMIKSIQSDTGGAVSSMEEGSKEVEGGVKLTNEAGEALKQIVREVQKVTDMVQQIATSTEEQSAASEEISSNVESVSSVVKETSSSIQESNHAVQELSRLATELNEIVDQFKLEKDEAAKEADDKEPEEK